MILIVVLLVLVIALPSIWIKYTIWKYQKHSDVIPGTGAELVQHLAMRFEINELKVERCQPGQDHYSPTEKTVRLSPKLYEGYSVSAVAIAAHEFGHALQYHRKERITQLREKYTPPAMLIEKLSIGLITISPLLVAIFKVPHIALFSIGVAILSLLISVALQLIILPMEWDASFNKAMPILIEGNYLKESDIPKARKLLRAAAFTYFAATLSSILNIWRWIRILRA